MRLAIGFTDTPALMALQVTRRPIGVASAFPGENAIIAEQLRRLEERPNVRFARTGPAMSTASGAYEARTGFHLPSLQAVIMAAGGNDVDANGGRAMPTRAKGRGGC